MSSSRIAPFGRSAHPSDHVRGQALMSSRRAPARSLRCAVVCRRASNALSCPRKRASSNHRPSLERERRDYWHRPVKPGDDKEKRRSPQLRSAHQRSRSSNGTIAQNRCRSSSAAIAQNKCRSSRGAIAQNKSRIKIVRRAPTNRAQVAKRWRKKATSAQVAERVRKKRHTRSSSEAGAQKKTLLGAMRP